ncbi:MAG: 30S ribosomal protein S9 [Candidatus Andersenbacteria bacterium]|nr:30S ribosomal protein S9 [Candidatus Andersenbacteria bacterium]MBI3250325.1 30S ribosomal protein S9 [Candidatus Andersenbacteria bacterium]
MTDAKKDRPYGLGRRKEAVAQVQLSTTPKERTVNGIAFTTYFPTEAMQNAVIRPLKTTSQDDVFGFGLRIYGGGKNSQADAASLAIARAILTSDEGYRKALRAAGLLTRDPRAKERKKPGLKRARRAPQFSKR